MAHREIVPSEVRERLTAWYPPELLERTRVLRGSLLGKLFGSLGQGAVTVNKTIHLTPAAPDLGTRWGTALLGHELFHVEQQARIGWGRFLLSYLAHWRPHHRRNGRSHPMEQPAYARGEEIYRALGD